MPSIHQCRGRAAGRIKRDGRQVIPMKQRIIFQLENLEEMDTFWDTWDLTKLQGEDTNNLNRITVTKTEAVILKVYCNADWIIHCQLYQTSTELIQSSKTKRQEESHPQSRKPQSYHTEQVQTPGDPFLR